MSEFVPNGYFVDKAGTKVEIYDASARSLAASNALEITEDRKKIAELTEEMANKKAVCMVGAGAPTASTEGKLGALYMDTVTGDVYKCSSAANQSGTVIISTTEGIYNCYIKGSNGAAFVPDSTSNAYNKHTATDYLDVSALRGKKVKISCHLRYDIGFAFYDANKTFIEGVAGKDLSSAEDFTQDYEYTVPSNAAYIRYGVYNSKNDISEGRVLCEGVEQSTEWKPLVENKTDAPAFTLPAKSVAVVGHEWNMYFHNIVNYMTDEFIIRCQMSPSITGAKQLDDVLRFTPSADDVGVHELTMKLYRKTEDGWVLVKTHTISINVIEDASATGKTSIFIGDSLTQAAVYPAEIQHNLSNGGLTSLGTRSETVEIGGVSLTVNHEGRAGWAAYDYTRTRDTYATNHPNPFWNEEAGAFDFSYYMTTQGYSGVDVVCIGLGTNGVDKIDDICTALDIMIASIHTYSPDIKVLVSLITLPATQDGCGNNNGLQNSELLKMQTLALNRAYLEKYQNTMTNVDVAELYFALDTKRDYNTEEQSASARNPQVVVRQTNNVHPSVYGYLKIADVWYNNILYHLTN